MTEETTAPAIREASSADAASAGCRDAAAAGTLAPVPAATRRDEAASRTRGESADQVTVRMPAESAYLSVLRTATAGLAARLDFTLDEIEDLRIAVDEACAMLLSQAIPGSSLECHFALDREAMTMAVSVPCLTPQAPASDTFAWTVLTALAGSVNAYVGDGDRLTIVMRKSRAPSGFTGGGS